MWCPINWSKQSLIIKTSFFYPNKIQALNLPVRSERMECSFDQFLVLVYTWVLLVITFKKMCIFIIFSKHSIDTLMKQRNVDAICISRIQLNVFLLSVMYINRVFTYQFCPFLSDQSLNNFDTPLMQKHIGASNTNPDVDVILYWTEHIPTLIVRLYVVDLFWFYKVVFVCCFIIILFIIYISFR